MTQPRPRSRTQAELPLQLVATAVCDLGEQAPGLAEKIKMIGSLSAKDRTTILETLLQRLHEASSTMQGLNETIEELRELVTRLTRHPWHTATFKSWISEEEDLAKVSCHGEERVVAIGPDLDTTTLGKGACVFLSAERNTMLALDDQPPRGQVGKVTKVYGPHRFAIGEHDLEVVAEPAHWLDESIEPGDQIIWCPRSGVVYERLSAREVSGVDVHAPDGGNPPPRFVGYDTIKDQVLTGFMNAVSNPELASRFGISPYQGSLLLHGPSGCGKTLLARNLAHDINATFFVINASAIYSSWFGESEQRIVEAFKKAEEAAPAILFIDEIDAIGRTRGGFGQHHSDRVASVLLTQMDGASGTPGIGVIGACNRADLLDPALESRFGRRFHLTAPRRETLREIVQAHLAADLPYPNGETRTQCIDAIVERLTSPNANNEIATVRFRDGKTRVARAADLVSGRAIKQIVESACFAAFQRAAKESIEVFDEGDVQLAVEETIQEWRSMLCVQNVRAFLSDLPDDVDVVAVEAVRDVTSDARYLTAGGH